MTVLDPCLTRLSADDVLVLRALGLGDALTGVAALRGVRRAWPRRRLVLAAPEPVGSWLARHGVVDAVLPTEGLRPAWPWVNGSGSEPGHVAVNLHGRGPQSHRLLQRTRPAELVAFGCAEAGHQGVPWQPAEHEVRRWCRLLGTVGGTSDPEDLRLRATPPAERDDPPPVLLHPGAASMARRWPPARWVALARVLTDQGHQVVLTGSAAEAGLCEAITRVVPQARSTAGALDLAALTALVGQARLLVCGDTGVAHLATALGTASVVLFGPTPPQWWGPAIDTDRHTVIWHGTGPGDPHAPHLDPALAQITVAEVAREASRLLG